METIGKRMKKVRLDRDLSLREVTQRAGVPLSTYREWEAGRQIKGEPYEKIAEALGVTLYWLMTGKPSNKLAIQKKLDEIELALNSVRNSLESLT